jgi:hypothetical protein
MGEVRSVKLSVAFATLSTLIPTLEKPDSPGDSQTA